MVKWRLCNSSLGVPIIHGHPTRLLICVEVSVLMENLNISSVFFEAIQHTRGKIPAKSKLLPLDQQGKCAHACRLNNSPLGDVEVNLKGTILAIYYGLHWWSLLMELLLGECQRTPGDKSVCTGLGSGLVPSGNKPLSEAVLTEIHVAIWRYLAIVTSLGHC